jgi:hypothetical protein
VSRGRSRLALPDLNYSVRVLYLFCHLVNLIVGWLGVGLVQISQDFQLGVSYVRSTSQTATTSLIVVVIVVVGLSSLSRTSDVEI